VIINRQSRSITLLIGTNAAVINMNLKEFKDNLEMLYISRF